MCSGLLNNSRGSLFLPGIQSDRGKGAPCCPTHPVARGGRFRLVLGLGEFTPALQKGCPDQHARRRPGKVQREGEAPPGLLQQRGWPCTRYSIALRGPVLQCPTSPCSQKLAPGGCLRTRVGTSAAQQPGVSHLSSSTVWVCKDSCLPWAAAEPSATDSSSVLSWDALVNEGATICSSVLRPVQPAQGGENLRASPAEQLCNRVSKPTPPDHTYFTRKDTVSLSFSCLAGAERVRASPLARG